VNKKVLYRKHTAGIISLRDSRFFFFDPHWGHDDYALKFTVDSPISNLGDTTPSLFLEHLTVPRPTLWETCKEKIPLCRVPRCPVNAAVLCPEKQINALIGKSIGNFDARSWHSPASNMFNNTSEKCAISSGGRLGCSKSLKAIESNLNNLSSRCLRKF